MSLDFATMTFAAGMAALLTAVCVVLLWLGHRNEPALKWLPLASLSGAIGLFMFWWLPTPRPVVPRILANLLFLEAHLFILLAFAVFYEKPLRAARWHVVILGGATLLFALNWSVGDWLGARVCIYVLGVGAPVFMTTWILLGGATMYGAYERSPLVRWMVGGIIGGHGVFNLARAVMISLDGSNWFDQAYLPTMLSALAMLDAVLLSTAMSWGMAALYGQKLARGLEHLAHRDPLTHMPNRLAIDEAFTRIRQCAREVEEPFCLGIVDLDEFKQINDVYGHDTGDRVLSEIGANLSQQLRPTDAVGRMGGDEFLVLLPGADLSAGQLVLGRMISEMPDLRPDQSVAPLGFSGGVAAYPQDGETFDELYRIADRRLYQAKQQGKGHIVSEPDAHADHNHDETHPTAVTTHRA